MTTLTPKSRWYHLTPDRFFIGLLVVQVFLLLSESFQWLAFNERKGWTVLIAVGVVGGAVLVMLLWGLVCLCLRRRFQFGVRSLLLFVVVVSVPLGWFAWEMQKARQQREVVEAITEVGGAVYYDFHYSENGEWLGGKPPAQTWLRKLLGDDFFDEVVDVECRDSEFGDDDARHLMKFTDLDYLDLGQSEITDNGLAHLERITTLKSLCLDSTQITDNGLAHIEGMTELERLRLDDTQITDNGLAHLAGMTKLAELRLEHTQITDNGLAHLREMTRLRELSLGSTQLTDKGLEHLKGLTNLEVLCLEDTQITDNGLPHLERMTELRALWLNETLISDKGLAHLKGLTKLEELGLWGTRVTSEAAKKLQQTQPNCVIVHSPHYVHP